MKKLSLIIITLLIVSANAFSQKVVRDSIKVGNKAYKEQLYGAAESKYKAAIQQDPNAKEAMYNLANTYYKQSKWDDALKEYEHYLSVENQSREKRSAALHNIGNTFLKKKDLQKSMAAYKEALRMNPTDNQTRYNLAVVQKMLKDQQDKNKDKDNKDDKKDQKEDEKKQDQPQDNKQDNQDKKDKKPEKQENEQMSESNARQILQAIEQDEKETQERVKKMKANERKKQSENNRKQDKDW